MALTKNDVIALGRVYGLIEKVLPEKHLRGLNTAIDCPYPLSALVKIHHKAVAAGALSGELGREVSSVLDIVDPDNVDAQGEHISLELQGLWLLAYNQAKCDA